MAIWRAQGATEYLVLLAVVLVIALVGIALLGFFPGTASDAQLTESQIYWESASPIAITETAARAYAPNGITYPYVLLKNNGNYPIRITALIGGDGGKAATFSANAGCGLSSGTYDIEDHFYLAPGEEKYFSPGGWYGPPCDRQIRFITGATGTYFVGGAISTCQNSSASPGSVVFNSFGFEYIQYVEGQQITKRQLGKAFIIKCREPA